MFSGHTGPVRCGQFTPDGKAVVTCGGEGDATLKMWDPKSGSCTGTVQGHGFHEAGQSLYTSSMLLYMHLWTRLSVVACLDGLLQ